MPKNSRIAKALGYVRGMKHVLILLITAVFATPVFAKELPSNDPNHAQCFKKSRKKPDWKACEQLVPLMLARHNAGEKVSGFISCVPDGTPEADVTQTFDKWISRRPHFPKYNAWDTLSGGLSVLYPCPK